MSVHLVGLEGMLILNNATLSPLKFASANRFCLLQVFPPSFGIQGSDEGFFFFFVGFLNNEVVH